MLVKSCCSVVALVLGCGAALSQTTTAADNHVRALLKAASAPETPVMSGKYVGPGSCSAVACHGGIRARDTTKVLQNEYSTWITSDKHAHAYTALTEPLGKQMAAILKIGPAEKAQRCLVCHAVSVPQSEHAREFDVAEGVSCESCHGPASAWIGPHIQPTAKHADMVRLGLVDNKDLAKRTERCLTCHLGAPGLNVDHELIAAGHPDLKFELDSYMAVQPVHWVEHGPNGAPVDQLFGVRAWAVGEAVEVQQSMIRVARHAKAGPWPEFSEMDCMTCHHSLTGPQSWRQQSGYKGHRAGDPPYNLARYVVFKHFAEEVNPGLNAQLATEAGKVASLVTSMSADRGAVEASANRAADLAGQIAAQVRDAQYDKARNERLLMAISGDADAIAADGERTAEQALMTLDSLYIAQAKAGGPNAATRQAIDALFPLLTNASAYNGPQFAAAMRKVRGTLK
jgi:hypothetical protein